jgi:hypothetical protein
MNKHRLFRMIEGFFMLIFWISLLIGKNEIDISFEYLIAPLAVTAFLAIDAFTS